MSIRFLSFVVSAASRARAHSYDGLPIQGERSPGAGVKRPRVVLPGLSLAAAALFAFATSSAWAQTPANAPQSASDGKAFMSTVTPSSPRGGSARTASDADVSAASAVPAASASSDAASLGANASAVSAGAAPILTASDVSPATAQRALHVLQDRRAREEAAQTLQAIAAVAPVTSATGVVPASAASMSSVPHVASAATPAPAPAPAVASVTPAAAASAASAASTAQANAPIQANGLIAQLLRLVGHWADGLSDQVHKVAQSVAAFPAFLKWLAATFSTARGQSLALQSLEALGAVFLIGLALEWGLRFALKRPRASLVRQAEAADHRAIARERAREVAARKREIQEARDARRAQLAAEAASRENGDAAAEGHDPSKPSTDAAQTAPAGDNKANAASGAATKAVPSGASAAVPAAKDGPPTDVALMRTVVDGEERIEAVPVSAGDGVSVQSDADKDRAEQAAKARDGSDGKDDPEMIEAAKKAAAESARHWSTLRHAPYALAMLIVELLPMLLFFIAAGLVLRWVAVDSARVDDMTEAFIDAYLTTRVTMIVIRLLFVPDAKGLQVLDVTPYTAEVVERWVRAIIVVAAFGVALVKGGAAFGASHQGQIAFMKLVSLIVHTCAVLLILKTRGPAGRAIAGAPDATGSTAGVRRWLADVWPVFGCFVVVAVWVVFALGVEDGFPKLIHFIGISVGVIVAARLFAIVLLGGLGRLFRHETKDGEPISASARLADRYYPIIRAMVTALLIVCACITLLQLWGFDAIAWFTRGTVGRNLTSAVLTIFVAAVVAIVVWESANIGVNRRLQRWTDRGDTVRAARLKTLVPMLRTSLFICIALVVGLTALNEIGINTTPLLAGASIIGVALGFGSQKLVQDFITGIFLLMENAMQVGDYVTVAGVSGSVEYLSIRTVRLRGSDGSLYIVPFSSVSTVNNVNRGLGNAAVRVSVSYDTDVDRVIAELKTLGAAMRQDDDFKDLIINDLEIWGVDAVDGASVTVAGQFRCLDKGRWGVQRAFNKRIFERFRELGIEIANPRLNYWEEVHGDMGPRGSQRAVTPETPGASAKSSGAAE
jgi:small-conductance mechanosensitive channel